MKKLLLTALLVVAMIVPVNIKAEESFKNFDYEFEPGKVRIVLNKEYDDNYTSTSAQMHNMVDYDLEGTAITKFYEHAMVYVETLDGKQDAYEVDLSKAVHGDVIEVTDDILIYVYSTGIMIFNVKENSGERVILDFDYEVEGDVLCGDYYVQFSGEHVVDNIPGAPENERFEVTIAEEDSCVVVPEPDIPEYPFDPEDWGVEGGYPTDPDTGDEWEKEANKKPLTPLEPATPIEKPEEPKEEIPLTPLDPAKPIEKPEETEDTEEVEEVPTEEPKEEVVEDDESVQEQPIIKDEEVLEKEETKPAESSKEPTEVIEVEETLSVSREPKEDVLPPTGLGLSSLTSYGLVALLSGITFKIRKR